MSHSTISNDEARLNAIKVGNARRQDVIRKIFSDVRNGASNDLLSVVRDPQDPAGEGFSFKDLQYFQGLYNRFKTAKSRRFPEGVEQELAQIKADEVILKGRGMSLDNQKLKRKIELSVQLEKLEAMTQAIDHELLIRKARYHEQRLVKVQSVRIARENTVKKFEDAQSVEIETEWHHYRDLSKAEALDMIEDLDDLRKDAHARGTNVLCVFGEKRIVTKKAGAAIRYALEKLA